MGFKLPWFGKKQDNAQVAPPAVAAPNETPAVTDTPVSPITTQASSDMNSDMFASAPNDTSVAAPVEQTAPDAVAQTDPAFSPETPAPTSPAAELMGQSAPMTADTVAPEFSQPAEESTEPTSAFDATPAPEVPAPDVQPQAAAPVSETPQQPDTPTNQ